MEDWEVKCGVVGRMGADERVLRDDAAPLAGTLLVYHAA